MVCLLFSFKQQIMIGYCWGAYNLICVQTPTLLFMPLYNLTDLFMVPYLNTDPLLQFFHLLRCFKVLFLTINHVFSWIYSRGSENHNEKLSPKWI